MARELGNSHGCENQLHAVPHQGCQHEGVHLAHDVGLARPGGTEEHGVAGASGGRRRRRQRRALTDVEG